MFAAELLLTLRAADEDDDAIIVEALRRSDELSRILKWRSRWGSWTVG